MGERSGGFKERQMALRWSEVGNSRQNPKIGSFSLVPIVSSFPLYFFPSPNIGPLVSCCDPHLYNFHLWALWNILRARWLKSTALWVSCWKIDFSDRKFLFILVLLHSSRSLGHVFRLIGPPLTLAPQANMTSTGKSLFCASLRILRLIWGYSQWCILRD